MLISIFTILTLLLLVSSFTIYELFRIFNFIFIVINDLGKEASLNKITEQVLSLYSGIRLRILTVFVFIFPTFLSLNKKELTPFQLECKLRIEEVNKDKNISFEKRKIWILLILLECADSLTRYFVGEEEFWRINKSSSNRLYNAIQNLSNRKIVEPINIPVPVKI